MRFFADLGRIWCQVMHPSPMWPVNGQYRCPSCLRVYPVAWESPAASPAAPEAAAIASRRPVVPITIAPARSGTPPAPAVGPAACLPRAV